MAPRSLFDQAKSTIIRNVDFLTEIGDVPYDFMKPILMRVSSAKQLREIEENSPQIVGLDGEVWLKLIKRDVPGWEKKPHQPKNPENWWKVYRKLKREADEEEHAAGEMLKQKVQKLKAEADSKKVAPPTRAIPETRKRGKAEPQFSTDAAGLRFTKGTKTKNIMQSARRQAAEASLTHQGALARPMHMLGFGRSKPVIQAPRHMIEDKQFEIARQRPGASPPQPQPPRLAPTSGPSFRDPTQAVGDLALREARLKTLQSGRAADTPRKSIETPPPQAKLDHSRVYNVPRLTIKPRTPSPPNRPSPAPLNEKKKAEPSVLVAPKRKAEPNVLMAPKRKAAPNVLMPAKRIKR